MIDKLEDYLNNKKIIILGFGVEGKSNYRFLRKYFPKMHIVIAYNKPNLQEEEEYLNIDNNLEFVTGEDYLKSIEKFDIILKSPGISFKGIDTSAFINKVTSQLELFLEYSNCYTIGVTGTKGKSTTSSLIYNMLIEQGKKAILLGNIGIPIFDHIEKIEEDMYVVLEMSSHGLEYIKKSPNIAILLNLYEEHLDHYESLYKYIEAKYNIFKYQKDSDIAIYNLDNELMNNFKYQYKQNAYGITIKENIAETKNTISLKDNKVYYNDKPIYNAEDTRNLKGIHNLNNIMFVLAVSNILKLNLDKTIKTINNFKTLEHRMEFVGTYNGVDYYNDSIATVPESTINCIEALEKVNTLIVGGNDRGVDLTDFTKYLENTNIENIICMPKTGEYIYNKIDKSNKMVVMVQNLEEAVRYAKELTRKGTICALSPAASSYGYFKNFKERGEKFKKLVSELASK